MTEGNVQATAELEDVLGRLEEARQGLSAALESCTAEHFETRNGEAETVKRALERTVDDLNFYYGRLAASALALPQPPCLTRAEFGSLREATMAVQVAHRRFANLLHDLLPADLDKVASNPELGTYTLRQVLELAAAQYRLRAQQVKAVCKQASARRRA